MQAAEPNNARPVYGREASIWPVYLSDGTRIAARGGPFYVDANWQIPTHYQYGADKLDLAKRALAELREQQSKGE